LIGRDPHEIWQDGLQDGQRRLSRPTSVLAATGLLGGFHVTAGLLAVVVTTGALAAVMPAPTAHVLGSLTFGIGFAFLTVGRSELFTENFLIPVVAAVAGHCQVRSVARLWAVTFALNLVGIALFVVLASIHGVLRPEALQAAGDLADTLADRSVPAALASAVIAGAIITTFTWLAEAAQTDLTRVVIALAVGFVLLAPSFNHSVIGFGEILFGLVAGTTSADVIDLLRNTGVAIAGNVLGGVVLVAFVRSVQAAKT
jgi:formate/nitrite transporter FocA (FNT family)